MLQTSYLSLGSHVLNCTTVKSFLSSLGSSSHRRGNKCTGAQWRRLVLAIKCLNLMLSLYRGFILIFSQTVSQSTILYKHFEKKDNRRYFLREARVFHPRRFSRCSYVICCRRCRKIIRVARRWMDSSLSIRLFVYGCHAGNPYSSNGSTSDLYRQRRALVVSPDDIVVIRPQTLFARATT